jgi:hypothetical protein
MTNEDRKFVKEAKAFLIRGSGKPDLISKYSEIVLKRLLLIIESLQARIEEQAKETKILEGALAFYADPETYFAIGFFPDPPCGEFMTDFEDLPDFGAWKPGKRAREAARNYLAILDKKKKELETKLKDRSEFGLTK